MFFGFSPNLKNVRMDSKLSERKAEIVMKKVLSVFLALILTLSLAACGPEKVAGGEKVWKVAVLLPYIGDQSYYDAVEAAMATVSLSGQSTVEGSVRAIAQFEIK